MEGYRRTGKKRGFTLIELLIVVAIIAILALIAVPNFLEAQTRVRVSRVHADMRSLATALETYFVDHNKYPTHRGSVDDERGLARLSTPVAFIQNPLMSDPFKPPGSKSSNNNPGLHYIYLPFPVDPEDYSPAQKFSRPAAFPLVNGHDLRNHFPGPYGWFLTSYGPDGILQLDDYRGTPIGADNVYMPYDATNGTVSNGDIHRFGP